MGRARSVFKREFAAYFSTPLAAIFLVLFLGLAATFTFKLGGFYERGQADLRPFFTWHPWLYLFLVPALAMRLWAEERRLGTIELLLTLPLTTWEAVVGKFLAAWAFAGLALALTFPMWLTVAWLGNPDHGPILTGYLGSLLMAGGFLAIGSCLSALTKNQVIAFVLAVVACFGFLVADFPVVRGVLEQGGALAGMFLDLLSAVSVLHHFESFVQGKVELRSLVFFAALIGSALVVNVLLVEWKKAR